MGSIPIINVKAMLINNEKCKHNTVSIQPATLIPGQDTASSSSSSPFTTPSRAEKPDFLETLIEYAVDWIVARECKEMHLCYKIRWLGYVLKHDKFDAP